jgi:hypothetical protein
MIPLRARAWLWAVNGQVPSAVVGSIMRFTSVIFEAGKPLLAACWRMASPSSAK